MMSVKKCAEQWIIGDKGHEASIRRSKCTIGVLGSRDMGYEKC